MGHVIKIESKRRTDNKTFYQRQLQKYKTVEGYSKKNKTIGKIDMKLRRARTIEQKPRNIRKNKDYNHKKRNKNKYKKK